MEHVLVAVDLQNDFISGSLGSAMAEAIVPGAVQAIRDPGYDTVIATKDTHDAKYLDSLEGQYLPVAHCVKGTPGWEFPDGIASALRDRNARIVEKPVFGSLDLALFLQEKEPVDVTLIGLCTDICVVSNALLLKAVLKKAKVRVLASCCAGTSVEKHREALDVMRSCQVEVIEEDRK